MLSSKTLVAVNPHPRSDISHLVHIVLLHSVTEPHSQSNLTHLTRLALQSTQHPVALNTVAPTPGDIRELSPQVRAYLGLHFITFRRLWQPLSRSLRLQLWISAGNLLSVGLKWVCNFVFYSCNERVLFIAEILRPMRHLTSLASSAVPVEPVISCATESLPNLVALSLMCDCVGIGARYVDRISQRCLHSLLQSFVRPRELNRASCEL